MVEESPKIARCPVCGLDVQLEGAPRGARSGIVCPNCGTPFSYMDEHIDLQSQEVTLLLDQYEIKGTVHLSGEYQRFSDAWESLIAGTRSFIPITDAEITRPGNQVVARAKFMQVQKSEIRGAVPSYEQL